MMHYQNEFDSAVQRSGGLPKGFSGNDVARSFGTEHPLTDYNRERESLDHLLRSGTFTAIEQLLQTPTSESNRQKWLNDLDTKYGENFHRYFTGA